ncbi:unnamed protein product [Candida verbasci]|uniref:Uncharacterized protein n=1 Tax=Candida verbasci TaxID=1227364 RepID=A0A9W4X969_9ASCO|nr:unnamed protein product [Candida verbasci]
MKNNDGTIRSSTPQPQSQSQSQQQVQYPTITRSNSNTPPTIGSSTTTTSKSHLILPKSNSSPPISLLPPQSSSNSISSFDYTTTGLQTSYEGRLPFYRSISAPSVFTTNKKQKRPRASPENKESSITNSPPKTPKSQIIRTTNEDGESSSPFNSNFQLPNDILRNLTPIIKSPPKDKSKNQINKQNYLRNIQARLIKKSNKIEKNLIDLKQQRLRNYQIKSQKFKENLRLANLRRQQYLEIIKSKANKFIKDEPKKKPRSNRI